MSRYRIVDAGGAQRMPEAGAVHRHHGPSRLRLERLDPDPEYWEGKRGACVGMFQMVVAGKAQKEDLRDVLAMVRNTSNPQVEYMVRIINKWCKENNVKIA